jgi:hypothetical protein
VKSVSVEGRYSVKNSLNEMFAVEYKSNEL